MKIGDNLSKRFSDAKYSGVYTITGKADDLESAARAAGLMIAKLDLGRVRGKTAFLGLLAKTLKFPEYFGKNWDALHDLLTDLSWHDAKGWLVIIANSKPFAERHKEHFATAIKVLQAAAEHWRSRGKPFWVVIQGEKNWDPGVPKLRESDP